MNFNYVAPFYRWLEGIVFGHALQRARTAFVRQIDPPRRVLIVGEGDGRFLEEFVRFYPRAEIDCVEASERMIALARRRVPASTVRFVPAILAQVRLEAGRYDLLVSHFFLDCFGEKTLGEVVSKLSRSASAEAQWLIADFCLPPSGWKRTRAQALIAIMYRFFRSVAGIEARRLVDYRPHLRAARFALQRETVSPNEMIRSEVWGR